MAQTLASLTTSVTQTLETFEHRIHEIENTMGDLHRDTQKLSGMEKNIQEALELATRVVAYFDLGAEYERMLGKLPKDSELDAYYAALQKIIQAVHFFKLAKLKGVENTVNQLKQIQEKSVAHLETIFKRWIKYCSMPANIDAIINPEANPDIIPPAELNKLITLVSNLQTEPPPTSYLTSYTSARSSYLLLTLPNTLPLPHHTYDLSILLVREKALGHSLSLQSQYRAVVGPAMESLIHRTNEFLEAKNRRLNDGWIFSLLLCLEDGWMPSWDAYVSTVGEIDIGKTMLKEAIEWFPAMVEEVKTHGTKPALLSVDGTVHELTSNVLNHLKRYEEYADTCNLLTVTENISYEKLVPVADGLQKWFTNILKALQTNLDIKSRSYKKPTLSALFLLNNMHYVSLALKHNAWIGSVVGSGFIERIDKSVDEIQLLYIVAWKPLIQPFGVKADATLSKQMIKDYFKDFNTTFDELSKAHQKYSIPDATLRSKVRSEIWQVLRDPYQNFLDRYKNSQYVGDTEKYHKYEMDNLHEEVEKFFTLV